MGPNGGVFIVTGSATGLGAAVARRLAGKGGRVVINYTRSLAEAEERRRPVPNWAGRPSCAKRTFPKMPTAAAWFRRPWTAGGGLTGW